MHDHDVVNARRHDGSIGTGRQVRTADDHQSIARVGESGVAGPVVGMADELLGIGRGRAAQRRHSPIQTHLPQGRFARADADRRHETPLLRERQRRAPRMTGDDDQLRPQGVRHRPRPAHDGAGDFLQVVGPRPSHLARRPSRDALLRDLSDAVHHFDRFAREFADCRLAGKHTGVGAVENGVGDVGRFGASGSRRLVHAVEHLRRDDRRLLQLLADANDSFLFDRHARDVDFDPQIAAGDHDTVGFGDDFLEPLQGLAFLDLRDHARLRTAGTNDVLQGSHFVRRADETQAHVVDSRLGRPDGVLMVLDADRRSAQLHVGQIDSLPAANGAALHHRGPHAARFHFFDPHAHRAVGEHDDVANRQLLEQRFVGGRQFVGSLRLAVDEEELLAAAAEDALAGDFAQSDLRPAEISQDGDRLIQLAADLPDAIDEYLLLFGPAVSHVQAKDVGARQDELRQLFDLAARRSDRGDDFRTGPLSARRGERISIHGNFAAS
jgi:hypothetical protein